MDYFCPAPWINISTDVNGSIRPCCRYEQPERQVDYKMPWMHDSGDLTTLYNDEKIEKLRRAFLQGEKPNECNWCWTEEKLGIRSFRQIYIDRKYDIDFEETQQIPKILDLKLSNVCNLKCRMCTSRASSSIAKEENKIEPYHQEFKILHSYKEKDFVDNWLPQILELELTGGEPFFSPENKQIIELAVITGHCSHIDLLITTNAMFYIPNLMEKMKNFKNVRISFSVDDIGPRLEYARSGAKWEIIQKNISNIITNYPEFDAKIYRTVNNFNINHLQELDEWAMNNDVEVINGFLHEDKQLNIQHLPYWIKEKINEKYKSKNSYQHILDFMNEEKENLLWEFHKEIQRLDIIRNESFKEIHPQWAELLFMND